MLFSISAIGVCFLKKGKIEKAIISLVYFFYQVYRFIIIDIIKKYEQIKNICYRKILILMLIIHIFVTSLKQYRKH